jgi:hypothetical protein
MRVCYKCGTEDTTGYIAKRIERGAERLCQSCSARPAKHIQTKFGRCKPHHGKFDDYDCPMDDNGEYILPGIRICGAKDCVEPTHIQEFVWIDPEPVERVYEPSRLRPGATTEEIIWRLRDFTTGYGANPEETVYALQEAQEWNKKNGHNTRNSDN